MIVGNGLIASVFLKNEENYKDYIIFASGVSSSKETKYEEFEREKTLLKNVLKKNNDLKLIYFSTILSDKIDNPYYQHKLNIENYIKKNCNNYKIYRIPQILGYSGNNDNLVNYFVNKIKKNEEISLYKNVKRSILDVEDLKNIVDVNIKSPKNEILNISSIEKISVVNLCKKIGDILNIKPKIKTIIVDTKLDWDTRNSRKINEIINSLDLIKKNYTNNTLIKYIKK
jgi:nucleoside-diphosphate-sugar epimerase